MNIDCEKLKNAYELGDKLNFESWDIQISYGTYKNIVLHFEDHESLTHEYEYNSLDELIEDLKDLTQDQKYNIGQTVWLIDCDMICTAKIKKYLGKECTLSECTSLDGKSPTGKDYSLEEKLHPSLNALIESQVEYWTKLKQDKNG